MQNLFIWIWQTLKIMIWHELPELPKPDTEVLAEVEGLSRAPYVIAEVDKDSRWWYHHIPMNYHHIHMNFIKHKVDYDCFFQVMGLSVKRWAYIEKE